MRFLCLLSAAAVLVTGDDDLRDVAEKIAALLLERARADEAAENTISEPPEEGSKQHLLHPLRPLGEIGGAGSILPCLLPFGPCSLSLSLGEDGLGSVALSLDPSLLPSAWRDSSENELLSRWIAAADKARNSRRAAVANVGRGVRGLAKSVQQNPTAFMPFHEVRSAMRDSIQANSPDDDPVVAAINHWLEVQLQSQDRVLAVPAVTAAGALEGALQSLERLLNNDTPAIVE